MQEQPACDRRLTHKAVMSSDELITLMEENVTDYALIVTDPQQRIINWSKGTECLFGYSVEEALGENVALIYTPEDRSHHVPSEEFQKACTQGRAANERNHLRKDGTLFWGSGILTALREEDGRVRGTVKILRDLTEQKQLTEDLRQETATALRERLRAESAAREIEQLNGLLRNAMAEAHHRIKNSFQMLSALLDMHIGTEAAGAPLDYEKLSLHIRALAAIHDLLTADVKTADAFDYVSARPLLEKLVALVQATLTGRTIDARLQDIVLPLKQGTSLAPLFSELLTNAIKHGKGTIEVTFSQENHVARLEVCDDGPGFPADFNPRKAANTGMELIETLVRHDLRGEIRYTNNGQGGAQVIVTFPLSTQET